VLKQGAENDLADAVRAAAAGHAYLNPQVGVRIAVEEERTNGRAAHLTGRELEVLRMVALGYTNPEMARQLGISVRTVEAHRSHLRSKIDVTTRAEFSAYARARHIV
jgi:two-component system response regulator NreC